MASDKYPNRIEDILLFARCNLYNTELYMDLEKYIRLEKWYTYKDIFTQVKLDPKCKIVFLYGNSTVYPAPKYKYDSLCDINYEINNNRDITYTFDFKDGIEYIIPYPFKITISDHIGNSLDQASEERWKSLSNLAYNNFRIDFTEYENFHIKVDEYEDNYIDILPKDLKKFIKNYILKSKDKVVEELKERNI